MNDESLPKEFRSYKRLFAIYASSVDKVPNFEHFIISGDTVIEAPIKIKRQCVVNSHRGRSQRVTDNPINAKTTESDGDNVT